MAVDAIAYILPALLLLWNALLLAIPIFVVSLCGIALKKFVAEKTAKPGEKGKPKKAPSEAKAAFIATYIIVFILVLLAYSLPYIMAQDSIAAKDALPDELKPTAQDSAITSAVQLAKLLLVSLAFSIMLLPFEFAGMWVFEKLHLAKKLNGFASVFAACFAMALCGLIMLLALPWLLSGVIFLVYFA